MEEISSAATSKAQHTLFSAFSQPAIASGRKLVSKTPLDKSLPLSPESSELWKAFVASVVKPAAKREAFADELLKGKMTSEGYKKLCKVFESVVVEGQMVEGVVLLAAAAGLQYSYAAILKESPSAVKNYIENIQKFHKFFFSLLGNKGNAVIPDSALTVLLTSIKSTIRALQEKIKGDVKLLSEEAPQLKDFAFIFWSLLETIVIVSVFGESESFFKTKYTTVLDYLKVFFALISQFAVFDKIFGQPHNFYESQWHSINIKHIVTVSHYSILSLYSHEAADRQVTLKYMLIYFHYKILKLMSKRGILLYDEHILSIFATLARKNKSLASAPDLSPQQVTALLNENIIIIKLYIVNVACFSENSDTMQRLTKYNVVRDISVASIALAMKTGFQSTTGVLSIHQPNDFIATIFKALLLYRSYSGGEKACAFRKELVQSMNILCAELMSKTVSSDLACLYSFRLYISQYLNEWEAADLKEKYARYIEELTRYLVDSNVEEHDSLLMQKLKEQIRSCGLGLYAKLVEIDCNLPIETIIGFIREDYVHSDKYFYILLSILCKQKVDIDKYEQLAGWAGGDYESIASLMGFVSDKEYEESIRKCIESEVVQTLFTIYKFAVNTYVQAKDDFVASQSDLVTRKTSATQMETVNYFVQAHLKELSGTISVYENLMKSTGRFLVILHSFPSVAKHYLKAAAFDKDFYKGALRLGEGRGLILQVLKMMTMQLSNKLKASEFVNQFASAIIEVLLAFPEVELPFEDEKAMVLAVITILEDFIASNVSIPNIL